MRILYFIVTLITYANICNAAEQLLQINYNIEPVFSRNPYFNVTIEINSPYNNTHLSVYSDIIKLIDNFNSDCKYTDFPRDKSHKIIFHAPHEKCKITYKVKPTNKSFANKLSFNNMISKSFILNDFIYYNHQAVFFIPDGEGKYQAKFSLKNIPSHWNMISNLGKGDEFSSSFDNYNMAAGSFTVLGETRLYNLKKYNMENIYISIYGDHSVKDEDFVNDLAWIIKKQNNYMNMKNKYDYFVVNIMPSEKDNIMGYNNNKKSITIYENLYKYHSYNIYYHLFAHEYFHNWINNLIAYEDNYGSNWWVEGFTEYFSILSSLPDPINKINLLNETNRLFEEYYISTARNVKEHFVSSNEVNNDPDIIRITYDRGFVVSFYLDKLIQKETSGLNSLKNVIQDILEYNRNTGNQISTEELIEKFLDKYIPKKYARDIITRHIMLGETIEFDYIKDILDFTIKYKQGKKIYQLNSI